MTDIKDGGRAFPGVVGPEREFASGMTMRDYFAAKAMAALIIANGGVVASLSVDTAKDAYMAADAMLAARETDK